MRSTHRYLSSDIPMEPCSACGDGTVYRDRETGRRLCLGCLRKWARLRRMGWTGRPADVAAVTWVPIPRELLYGEATADDAATVAA